MIDLQTRAVVGSPIPVGVEAYGVTVTPDGRTVYVPNYGSETISVIDTATNQVKTTIALPGAGAGNIAIVPDRSPLASLTANRAPAGKATRFDGSASSDPDGLIAAFDWTFGDGRTASTTGAKASHKYAKAKKYSASLAPVDNEGCSTGMVVTGRTAYCSGAPAATKKLKIKAPNTFSLGTLSRNASNGTAKLKLPYSGQVKLWGKGLRATRRHTGRARALTLTIKPQPSLAARLATTGTAKARVRVKFKPTGGTARTKARTVTLVAR